MANLSTDIPTLASGFGMIDVSLTSITLRWIVDNTWSSLIAFVLEYGVLNKFNKSITLSADFNEAIIDELEECTLYNVRLKSVNMVAESQYKFINVSTFCKYVIRFRTRSNISILFIIED